MFQKFRKHLDYFLTEFDLICTVTLAQCSKENFPKSSLYMTQICAVRYTLHLEGYLQYCVGVFVTPVIVLGTNLKISTHFKHEKYGKKEIIRS